MQFHSAESLIVLIEYLMLIIAAATSLIVVGIALRTGKYNRPADPDDDGRESL